MRAPGRNASRYLASDGQAAAGSSGDGQVTAWRYVVSGQETVTPSWKAFHQEEITRFYAANREPIRRWLIACGCPAHRAEDAIQDSILAVRERWWHVRNLEKPQAYWYKAAWRVFAREQAIQTGRYVPGDPDDRLMTLPDPADPVGRIDRRELAMALLGELPLRQRQVFWLRRAAGFSTPETARILTIAPGTVKSQLHDAEIRMQELANKYDGDVWGTEAGPR